MRINKLLRAKIAKKSAELRLAKTELKNICELGNSLTASLDVNTVFDSIVRTVPRILKVKGCILRIVDENKTTLRLEASYGISEKFKSGTRVIAIGEGISGRTAKTETPIIIADIHKDGRLKYYRECSEEGMRSIMAVPIKFKDQLLGVVVAFSKKPKHFNNSEIKVFSAFAAHAAIALNNAILHNKVHRSYYNTMITLVKAMEAKDSYTCGHSERVTIYAVNLAKRLKLQQEDIQLLQYGARLHDIGKIAIPDFILKKRSALNMAERAEIEAHPEKGVEMIINLKFLEECFPMIKHHHERYDGGGYPTGLKGERIPLLARILSLVDAFDAMTSERPYRKGLSIDEAVIEIRRNYTTQFDPYLAGSFLEILGERPETKITEEIICRPVALVS